MAFEIPVAELYTVSVTVIVRLPAVCRVAENVPVPFAGAEFAGSAATRSVLLKRTVPV
jgi:hypothetical protein